MRATNAASPPVCVACAPPLVPGKFVDSVHPATYTSPVVGGMAMASAVSWLLPPRYVDWTRVVKPALRRATNASEFPKSVPCVACAPPAVPGRFVEDESPAAYTSPVVRQAVVRRLPAA